MKWFLGGLLFGVLLLLITFYILGEKTVKEPIVSSVVETTPTPVLEKPKEEPLVDYSEYTFDNLAKKSLPAGQIKLGKVLDEKAKYTSSIFTYLSEGKTVSGMINLPKGKGPFSVIVLLRGYADKTYYHTGLGTERSANFLAENGFLTLAPDFLGYGNSDLEDEDILKARFYRPVEVLSLLSAVSSLPSEDGCM